MEKESVIQKTNELIHCENGIIQTIEKKVKRLIDFGEIDFSNYQEGDYSLPKILLCVALKELAKEYTPHRQKLVKRLELDKDKQVYNSLKGEKTI